MFRSYSFGHLESVKWLFLLQNSAKILKCCLTRLENNPIFFLSQISTHDSKNRYLNTNGPLHVGGVSFGANGFQQVAQQLGIDR